MGKGLTYGAPSQNVPGFNHHKQEETHQTHVFHPRSCSRISQVCKIPGCKHSKPTKLKCAYYKKSQAKKTQRSPSYKEISEKPLNHKIARL